MKPFFPLFLIAASLLSGAELAAQTLLTDHEFQLVKREQDATTGENKFYGLKVIGSEVPNNSLNRLSIISENQYHYPEPESGCGPTAMLNILVWYEKYGLIKSRNRDSDTARYKQTFFREIDSRLNIKAGRIRSGLEGTNNFNTALVMDDLVKERSGGEIRIHTDFVQPPLKLRDLLDSIPNYRAGYLMGYPKDPNTGQQLDLHAMTLVRTDRAGYVTVGSWGQMYRGILKKRGDAQWLITQSPQQLEFRIIGLVRFIPFKPAAAPANP